MKIKIKKLVDWAKIPCHETAGSAGLDLTATSKEDGHHYTEYGTGIAVQIPSGYVGLIFPRSSVSKFPYMSLANAVGVIDSDYRGELKCRFRGSYYRVGDRIAQLVIIPYERIVFEKVESLEETDRGDGGFGSTNK